MLIYIAGPIAGHPNGNREAFSRRADELRAAGLEPLNPWDIPVDDHEADRCIGRLVEHSDEHRYGCFLRKGLVGMMFCDGISLLDGWESSPGACVEEHVARTIGLPVIEF